VRPIASTYSRQPWSGGAFRHTAVDLAPSEDAELQRARRVLTLAVIMHVPPAIAFGPDDEVVTIDDEDILDDDEDCPVSILDPEKAHDDAC